MSDGFVFCAECFGDIFASDDDLCCEMPYLVEVRVGCELTYIFQIGSAVKVGRTTQGRIRLARYFNDYGAVAKVRLLALTNPCEELGTEAAVLRMAAESGSPIQGNEWFQATPDLLQRIGRHFHQPPPEVVARIKYANPVQKDGKWGPSPTPYNPNPKFEVIA